MITIAETIKGINVVIGAETTGLSKALADVNKQSRDIQSELKQVEKLLKLDPQNTELIAQKQKLLGDAVANTRGKLDRLKSAQEQVNQQFAKGEISEGQYRAFQREIITTEQALNKLEQQGQETKRSLSDLGASLQNTGDKMKGVGQTLTLGVTAPIVAAGVAAVKFASDMEESTNKVNVAFGGSADKVKAWADTTLESYGIAEGSALDMAALFGDMGTAMGQSQEEAAKMSMSLVGLAGDLASFKNIGIDQAQEALKGIFTGEGEALKTLGIVMQDSTLEAYALATGQKKAYDEMTQAEKVALRYSFVMDAAKNSQGDFARTSDGTANQLRIMQESLKELAASIGEVLLPIITPIVAKLNEWAQSFAGLDEGTKKIIVAIAGIAAAIGPALIVLGFLASSIGSIIGFFAVGATGVSAFAATMAVITGPIGLAVAAIAAITAGGIALYNHLQKDAIPEVQLFGEKTSEATKKAVGAYMDLDEKAGQSLMNLKLTGETVTKEMADSLTGTFSQMTASIKQGMEKDFQESLSSMKNYLDTSDALSKEEEQNILADMQSGYNSRQQAIQEGEKRIKEILQNASQEKRGLSQAELAEIGNIQQQMKEKAVQTLSETELESKAILERMRQQAGDITAKQAAEVAKNSADQRDKAVKAAEDQYSNVIKEIIRQRDEAGTISSEQADKLINDATRQRDEAIKKAEEMHKGVIGEAKKQAGEHVNSVNWETGEVLSKWEKFKGDVKRKWEEIRQATLDIWNSISSGISNTINSITSTVKSSLESVWAYIKAIPSQAIQWGRNIIQALVNGIKSIRIPLPHIGVTWDSYSVGGKSINVPDFGINWYAKGGIFASPSVIGVGEAGTEVVAPLDELKKYLGNGQPVEVTLKLDSAVLSRQLVYLNQGKLRGAGA